MQRTRAGNTYATQLKENRQQSIVSDEGGDDFGGASEGEDDDDFGAASDGEGIEGSEGEEWDEDADGFGFGLVEIAEKLGVENQIKAAARSPSSSQPSSPGQTSSYYTANELRNRNAIDQHQIAAAVSVATAESGGGASWYPPVARCECAAPFNHINVAHHLFNLVPSVNVQRGIFSVARLVPP